jgi:hypothetical protein
MLELLAFRAGGVLVGKEVFLVIGGEIRKRTRNLIFIFAKHHFDLLLL